MNVSFSDQEILGYKDTLINKRNITINSLGTLTQKDLLNDMAVTTTNKVLFPIVKTITNNFFSIEKTDKIENVMYDLEGLRTTRLKTHRYELRELNEKNRIKYIDNLDNIHTDFIYYGKKNLAINENYKADVERQQKFLEDNNYIQVIVSHTDCGYDYRGHSTEAITRDYADFICDGTNDTQILQQAIDSHPGENLLVLLLEDEYTLKPSSGSGTEDDPYVCLNINRDNLIIKTCDRRTSITFDDSVTDRSHAYLFKTNGHDFDLSNVNLCMDELSYFFEEYTYPEPTEKMLEVKAIVEATDPYIKQYSKYEVLQMLNESSNDTNE